ncbi:hypothetical protein [Lysinibacillus sp. 54212]|uniref:hypothetical protein n=1 Tax=Lysinibacillus sp. 54212 TaxID=3119829 RepID=UPI002FC78111
MKEKDYKDQFLNQIDAQEDFPEKLAVIASVITTLGDAIATMAAMAALQQAQSNQNSSNISTDIQSEHSKRLDSMQKQIDYLLKKIERIERKR